MDNSIWIAVLALFGGFLTGTISPMLLAWQIRKNNRADKEEDYRRQDEVAQNLLDRQDATSARTAEVAELLASTTITTNAKLDGIGIQVDGQMTESRAAELGATKRALVLMLELASRKRSGGINANPDAAGEIAAARRRIAELEAELVERRKQAVAVQNAAPV